MSIEKPGDCFNFFNWRGQNVLCENEVKVMRMDELLLTSCRVHIRVRDVSDGETGHVGGRDSEAGELNGWFGLRSFGDGAWWRGVCRHGGCGQREQREVILPLVSCTWEQTTMRYLGVYIYLLSQWWKMWLWSKGSLHSALYRGAEYMILHRITWFLPINHDIKKKLERNHN